MFDVCCLRAVISNKHNKNNSTNNGVGFLEGIYMQWGYPIYFSKVTFINDKDRKEVSMLVV